MVTYEDTIKILEDMKHRLFVSTEATLKEETQRIRSAVNWDARCDGENMLSGLSSMQLYVMIEMDRQIEELKALLVETQTVTTMSAGEVIHTISNGK